MTERPIISVVVPVLDPEDLEACAQALAEQTYPAERREVIVADNGGYAETAEIAERYGFGYVRILERGSYRARNAAARATKGAIVAFTDSDCVPDADWISEGVEFLLAHPEAKAAGGRVVMPLGAHASAAQIFSAATEFDQEHFVRTEGFAATANLLVRREAFEARTFDESLLSGGDVEWCRAISRDGGLAYAENATVMHPPRTNVREIVRKWIRVERGLVALHRKDPSRFPLPSASSLIGGIFYPRRLLSKLQGRSTGTKIGVLWLNALVRTLRFATRLRYRMLP